MMKTPLILDLKGNSLDDGPGIRTTIFVKGCSLDCAWCHNPESKSPAAELTFDKNACIGCGECISLCPRGALSKSNEGFVSRDKCVDCFSCVKACPAKALKRSGIEMTMEEVYTRCAADKPFYDVSGGGVTFSGGEPGLYPQWCGELAKRFKDNGISVYLETAGNYPYEPFRQSFLPHLSGIYYDLKLIYPIAHRKYCGAFNKTILENFVHLVKDSKEYGFTLLPRTPLVPGITDTDRNLKQIATFYQKLGIRKTSLLPYNPTWTSKCEGLGITVKEPFINLKTQTPEQLEHCRSIFLNAGIDC